MRAAGITWILVALLGLQGILTSIPYGLADDNQGFLLVPFLIGITVSLCFIIFGVRTLRGSARDTVVSGTVSIAFSLFSLFAFFAFGRPENAARTLGYLTTIFALVIAGVLAIGGRLQYLKWREYRTPADTTGRWVTRIVAIALIFGILIPNIALLIVVANGWHQPAPPSLVKMNPNLPDRNEDPVPAAGWTVLFRSDNPKLWNIPTPPNLPVDEVVIPVRKAHSKIRYLRLMRMDTSEVVIIPIDHKQLSVAPKDAPAFGYAWQGEKRGSGIAERLGVIQAPPTFSDNAHGVTLFHKIGPEGWQHLSGYGFGTKPGSAEQGYVWNGAEIAKTKFEIALRELTEANLNR